MQHHYSVLIIAVLVIFGIYRRVRRSIGVQVLHPGRLRTRAYLFIVICLLFLVVSYTEPLAYISEAVGILLGLILAYFAMNTTRFERGSKGWMYRQHGWIGAIVIAVFFARLVDKFYEAYSVVGTSSTAAKGSLATAQAHSSLVGDPWTAGMFFILFAYYPCYFLFLARKAKQLDAESGENEWNSGAGIS